MLGRLFGYLILSAISLQLLETLVPVVTRLVHVLEPLVLVACLVTITFRLVRHFTDRY